MQEEHHSLSSTWVNTAIKPIDELKMMTVFDICLKYSRSPREVRSAYKRLLREEALAYPVTEAMRMDTNNNSIHDRDMNSDSTGPEKGMLLDQENQDGRDQARENSIANMKKP